jgi:hypothetical protein
VIPNPLFDVAGIIAGALRMPIGLYVVAGGAGKIVKNVAALPKLVPSQALSEVEGWSAWRQCHRIGTESTNSATLNRFSG